MDKLSVTCVDSYMTGITYDVAGLRILNTINGCTHISVRSGRMRQAYAEVIINTHNETGTVRTVCQAGTAVYIGIPHKLHRKLHDIRT